MHRNDTFSGMTIPGLGSLGQDAAALAVGINIYLLVSVGAVARQMDEPCVYREESRGLIENSRSHPAGKAVGGKRHGR